MKQRIDVITLAVADLERSFEFYRDGLGLESAEIVGTDYPGDDVTPAGAAAMFKLEGGLLLMLYPRTELSKDANIPLGPAQSGELSLGHAVASRAEVDALLARAEAAGATLTDRPHDRPWGIYSGYFRDLDGHLWEVLWNPRSEHGAGEAIRDAGVEDAESAARLLHDFNTEFSAPTPGVEAMAGRVRALLAGRAATLLLAGEPPCGIAVLRLRPSLWTEGLDAYLEELYVEPDRRGQGIGRALLEAAIERARLAGAVRMEIGTSETDAAARKLYERCGFSDREGGPSGPQMLFYERDI